MSGTAKLVLALGLLTLVFTLTIFGMAGKVHALSGEYLLDMRVWGSTPESVAAFAAALKAGGAEALHERIRVLDLIYPLVYGGFGIMWLSHLFAGSKARILCLLPFAALVFDFLENNLIARHTADGAELTEALVSQMTFYTQAKYGMIALSLVVLQFGFLRWRIAQAKSLEPAKLGGYCGMDKE